MFKSLALIRTPLSLLAKLTVVTGIILIALPLVLTVYVSFFDETVIMNPPRGFTLAWYGRILDRFALPIWNSILVALVAVSISLVLGVAAAIGLHRGRFRGRDAIGSLLLSPLTLPAIALGIGIYVGAVLFEVVGGVRLINSFGLLTAAHVLIATPWIVRLCLASLALHDESIEEAAASLGASPPVIFWRITLPVIRPGIIAGGLFAFIISFENLDLALFLAGPRTMTLPVATLGYLEFSIDPLIAALAVAQIVLVATILLLVDRVVSLGSVMR